jgi:hypothetical protein
MPTRTSPCAVLSLMPRRAAISSKLRPCRLSYRQGRRWRDLATLPLPGPGDRPCGDGRGRRPMPRTEPGPDVNSPSKAGALSSLIIVKARRWVHEANRNADPRLLLVPAGGASTALNFECRYGAAAIAIASRRLSSDLGSRITPNMYCSGVSPPASTASIRARVRLLRAPLGRRCR